MNHPQTEEPAPAAPMIFQASTAEASDRDDPRVDRPAPAEDAGRGRENRFLRGQQESLGVGTEGESASGRAAIR